MLQTLLPSLIVQSLNAELERKGIGYAFNLDGGELTLVDACDEYTGEEKSYPVTLESLIGALTKPSRSGSNGVDTEELAESVAQKVLEKLASPEFVVPVKVDARTLAGLFGKS